MFACSACNPVGEQKTNTHVSELLPQCISSQSQCDIVTEIGSFNVKFAQVRPNNEVVNDIKTESPFVIELSFLATPLIENIDKEESLPVQVDKPNVTIKAHLEGRDMFMGKIPIFFEQNSKSDVGERYSAESLLGSCSEEEMIWRLWLTVEREGMSQTFFVDFTSQRS
ncbi:hypothetical protein KO502_09000 [Colwellia sp. E2M01]|nr:hypothetical protein [Colwellia sp. E2M01]MBU2870836.1 hypothetical protein [Colwellia sp. E2M01]